MFKACKQMQAFTFCTSAHKSFSIEHYGNGEVDIMRIITFYVLGIFFGIYATNEFIA